MNKINITIIALAFSLSLTGCATVSRGVAGTSKAEISVNSSPEGATVTTDHGHRCNNKTPCRIIGLDRRQEFYVTIKKNGCKTKRVLVESKVGSAGAAGVAGNILAGGIIGIAVDAASGASRELVPDRIEVNLDC